MRVFGYARARCDSSAAEQRSLDLQREAVAESLTSRGWCSVGFASDVGLGANDAERPGLREAMTAMGSGRADVLMVTELDRIFRSSHLAKTILRDAANEGWILMTSDGLDVANLDVSDVALASRYEVQTMKERTRMAIERTNRP